MTEGARSSDKEGHPGIDEMMTVAASHERRDGVVCFVGIGLPSEAARIVMLGTMRVGVARVSRRSSRR